MIWKNSIAASACLLVAACGGGGKEPIKHELSKINTGPVAKIEPQISSLKLGSETTFSATNSYDLDGDNLSYEWTLIRKSDQASVALDKNNNEKITVILEDEGEYLLTLKVNDGKILSTPAQLQFSLAGSTNLTANAGMDFTVKKGQVVNLNGAQSSTLNGVISSYKWEIIEKPQGSTARIFKNQRVKTNFVADRVGLYRAELTIENSLGAIAKDTVEINSDALNVNSKPVVILTSEKSLVMPNEVLLIDATQSYDPDRFDRLSFAWSILSAPAESDATLSSLISSSTSFSASVNGEYVVGLRLADSHGAYSDGIYQVSVASSNQAPIAQLGNDMSTVLGQSVTLSCEYCFDPEGAELSYNWQLLGQPDTSTSVLESTTSPIATLNPDMIGEYLVAVTISDGETEVTSNTQIIDVRNNQKPISKIFAPLTASLGERVILDGSHSFDPEGAELNYEWKIIDQPNHDEIYDNSSALAYFTPMSIGDYIVSLRTNDGTQYSDPETTAISVKENQAPVIVIQGDLNRTIALGENVDLNAAQSYDPEGEAITFLWTLHKPDNSTVTLQDDSAKILQFTPDIAGIYIATLTITDPANNLSSESITVEVTDLSDVLTGTVKGRIVDTTLSGVENALLSINGKEYSSDQEGFFNITLDVEEGNAIKILTADSRLVKAQHVTAVIAQQDFIIDLGESFVPVKQEVDTYLWTCGDYSGPENINLRFNMIDTFPATNKFTTHFDETFSFAIDSNKNIALPSTASYELFVDDEVTITAPGPKVTIYYAPILGAINIVTICNK